MVFFFFFFLYAIHLTTLNFMRTRNKRKIEHHPFVYIFNRLNFQTNLFVDFSFLYFFFFPSKFQLNCPGQCVFKKMVSPCDGHTCSLDKSTQKGLLCQWCTAKYLGKQKMPKHFENIFFLMDKPVDYTNDGSWSLMHILTKWLTQRKDYKCLQFTSFSLDSLMDCRLSQSDTRLPLSLLMD